MHKYALVNKFIDYENNSAHIVDQRLSFYLMFEYFVKALINTVKNLTQYQLVVLSDSKNIHSHISIASKHCHVVVNYHYIVF